MNQLMSMSVADAPLPVRYEAAKTAIAECAKLDECKDWADKAEALRSYARQAGDDSLVKMANRIRDRALRRAGELLKQFDARGDHRKSVGTDTSSSQREAAREAGLMRYLEERRDRSAVA